MSSLEIPKSKFREDDLASNVAKLNDAAEHFGKGDQSPSVAAEIHHEAIRIFTEPFSGPGARQAADRIAREFTPWITKIKSGRTYYPATQLTDPFRLEEDKIADQIAKRPPIDLIAKSSCLAFRLLDKNNSTQLVACPATTRLADQIFANTLKLEASGTPGSLANAVRNLTYPWTLRDDPAIQVDPIEYYVPHMAANCWFRALEDDNKFMAEQCTKVVQDI